MSTEIEKSTPKSHHFTCKARQETEITGVTDVISFDEQSIALDTVCGNMNVDGDALHIQILNLDEGLVSVSGRIDAITYFDSMSPKESKKGFLGRLLR